MARRQAFWSEPALIALENLWAHKLRSFLTLLGVIIAVAALIGVVSAVDGLNTYVAERVANFGTNVFYVARFPIITNAKDFLAAKRRNSKIRMDDFEYLQGHLTLADQVGAQDWRFKGVRGGGGSLDDVNIRGATPNIIDIATDKVASGRFFTPSEYEHRRLVAFIGADVAQRIFPQRDPLGQAVWVENIPFDVVGVAETQGSAFGQSQDNFIYIPLTTLQKVWGEGPPDEEGLWIGVKCSSPGTMVEAEDQARAQMRARRHQPYDDPDAFGIIASESVTSLWNQIFGGLANVSIGVVSIFLVIGGVVIMNIMLASVTERTREIGIRKSLGARQKDILLQFLVEASVMSAVGGIAGVVFSLAVTELVKVSTGMPMRTPLNAVMLAIGVSTGVGVFFGLWPALRAARLDPVEALRAE
ncbi:MAG: ABC transporter permease [Candidatus Acidiferrales bacterium]